MTIQMKNRTILKVCARNKTKGTADENVVSTFKSCCRTMKSFIKVISNIKTFS